MATGTIAANIIPSDRRGEGVSYYAMSTTLASAVGPFLGMYLMQRVTFDKVVVLCASLTAISYVAFLSLKERAADDSGIISAFTARFKPKGCDHFATVKHDDSSGGDSS
jgi:predicted MFS family arabinose efflux permease